MHREFIFIEPANLEHAVRVISAVLAVIAVILIVRGLADRRWRRAMIAVGAVGLFALTAASFIRYSVAAKRAHEDNWQTTGLSSSTPGLPAADRPVHRDRTARIPPRRALISHIGPRMSVVDALGVALRRAWIIRGLPAPASPPAVVAPQSAPMQPLVAETQAGVPDETENPASQSAPAWVNAEPKMQGDVYLREVHVGPYTTPVECEGELHNALQQAVAEYAELLLGREAAKQVRLPDEALQQLVRERWTETRPFEIAGGTHEMLLLHALVGFDRPMQQRIRAAAEEAVVDQRLKGAGVVFGGVLGLLALTWGGLKLVGGGQQPHAQASVVAANSKARGHPIAALGCIMASVLMGILVLLWWWLSAPGTLP